MPGLTHLPFMPASVLAAIPKTYCLNVTHCTNQVDYLCDKSNLDQKWCTCWGGVTECVTLGSCKYTPCKTCQLCLTQMQQLLRDTTYMAQTNKELVAAQFADMCRNTWNRPPTSCDDAVAAILASVAGNAGKRGGQLCQAMGDCANSSAFETTCSLKGMNGSTTVVPQGNLSLCTVQGTTPGDIVPGGLVAPAGANLTATYCRVTADCNNPNYQCGVTPTKQRCVCNSTTGIDECEGLKSCKLTPCATVSHVDHASVLSMGCTIGPIAAYAVCARHTTSN